MAHGRDWSSEPPPGGEARGRGTVSRLQLIGLEAECQIRGAVGESHR